MHFAGGTPPPQPGQPDPRGVPPPWLTPSALQAMRTVLGVSASDPIGYEELLNRTHQLGNKLQ